MESGVRPRTEHQSRTEAEARSGKGLELGGAMLDFAGAALRYRWPLDVEAIRPMRPLDPYVAIVRSSMIDYASGRSDLARRAWADSIRWRLQCGGRFAGDHHGAEGIFDYHRRLEALTGGTFQQRVIALQASGGPIVEAHLRTTATRRGDRLEIPSLLVFEVGGGQVQVVTELPGDPVAWEGFWSG
jgi:hypothetical protein